MFYPITKKCYNELVKRIESKQQVRQVKKAR